MHAGVRVVRREHHGLRQQPDGSAGRAGVARENAGAEPSVSARGVGLENPSIEFLRFLKLAAGMQALRCEEPLGERGGSGKPAFLFPHRNRRFADSVGRL